MRSRSTIIILVTVLTVVLGAAAFVIGAIVGNNKDDDIEVAATECTSDVSASLQTTASDTTAATTHTTAAPATVTETVTTTIVTETKAPNTTAATEPPVEENQIQEEYAEQVIAEEPADRIEENDAVIETADPAPVNTAPVPFFNDIYIYNSAPDNADGQRFTLHAGGTYDYWIADIYVHSPDASKIMSFTARGTDVDTWLVSGSCYDYVTVTIVPYHNDGTNGDSTTVRYDVTVN